MGQILRHWRIPFATLFSAALVIGAFLLAKSIESPSLAQASAETALLQAIAAKDSDVDGLPDWGEVLYGTDPHTVDTNHLGMTDGEAVEKGLIVPRAVANVARAVSAPNAGNSIDYAAVGLTAPTGGTLTDAFAKNFFALYLAAKQANGGVDLAAAQTNALAEQTMTELSQSVVPTTPFKRALDLKVSGSGPEALRAFAVAAETVIRKNASDATKSEIQYFQDAVQNDDASARAHLRSLANAYRDSAIGIAALSVPAELAETDLAIVNALMRLSEIDGDFSRVDTDPLAAMLALQQFRQTELSAEQAFIALANLYKVNGVSLPRGAPGASFVNLMADITARQQAAARNL